MNHIYFFIVEGDLVQNLLLARPAQRKKKSIRKLSVPCSIIHGILEIALVRQRFSKGWRSPQWKHPNDKMGSCLVDFVLKMKRLVALFLGFSDLETVGKNDIRSMMKQKVAPLRPALWFNLVADLTDPHVPFIHYHEIIAPSAVFHRKKRA